MSRSDPILRRLPCPARWRRQRLAGNVGALTTACSTSVAGGRMPAWTRAALTGPEDAALARLDGEGARRLVAARGGHDGTTRRTT